MEFPHPLLHIGTLLYVATILGRASTGIAVRRKKEDIFMSRVQRSTALYPHPFSRSYWRDAAAELKDTRMLVITALLVALRIALKPFAIPVGPQMYIQTPMLATALGAMIFGPVMAIPAAIVSDTIGFIIHPTGEYFLPFVLTEIASTVIYALCLYRSKATPTRVMIARFLICSLVNVVLQQLIYAWYYIFIGNPESARNSIMGIMTVSRIFKNLFFFPIETVILTLFLKVLIPVTNRMKLTYCPDADMRFTKKQIAALICLVIVGLGSAVGYLTYRYDTSSRSADYSTEERMEANQEMTRLVLEKTNDWDEETVVCIVDSAYRGLFEEETDYTVSVYTLDEAAFAAGQADNAKYTMDTLWSYSKSGPKKDKYGSLVKVATAQIVKNEKSGEILSFDIQ